MKKDLAAIIAADTSLAKEDSIIQSIPGIGPIVSGKLIAELPELTQATRKKAAALVRVAPFNFGGWFDTFRSAGKPYKVAVIACVRKLLTVIRAMLISKTTWDYRQLRDEVKT